MKEFAAITDADWRRYFEVNVLSGVRLARAYFPGMLERNWAGSSSSPVNRPKPAVVSHQWRGASCRRWRHAHDRLGAERLNPVVSGCVDTAGCPAHHPFMRSRSMSSKSSHLRSSPR